MDSTAHSIVSYNSSSDCKAKNDTSAKLRRLKIQESLLLQSIKKDFSNRSTDENNFFESCSEFKKFLNNINNTYTTIKNLLTDIKSATQSEEVLKSLDINDIKKDIFDLDEKIKSFKMFLQSEQAVLKQHEQDIMRKINETTSQNSKIKVIKGVTAKSYSGIIPSPVKNLINSPLKCLEVQNFQDFLNVTHKYGGWNEYHHNTFVKFWQKHIKQDNHHIIDSEGLDSPVYNRLTDDFLNKVPGFKRLDVISHIKWYSRYLHLKSCQRHALEEWRAKNRPLKTVSRTEKKKESGKYERANCSCKRKLSEYSQKPGRYKAATKLYMHENRAGSSNVSEQKFHENDNANEDFKEINNSLEAAGLLNKNEILSYGFTKPTKQWDLKCKTLKEPQLQEHSIEHVTKLGIPAWRLGLQEY